MFSFCSLALCSLEILDLQTSDNDPSTRSNHWATIQNKQQVQLRTIHQTKEKLKKNTLKDSARFYSYEGARNTENGTKTAILWDKRCFRDLVAINYRVKS